jgi:hypothetical protein
MPDGPASGLSSLGAVGMDGDREDRDRGVGDRGVSAGSETLVRTYLIPALKIG